MEWPLPTRGLLEPTGTLDAAARHKKIVERLEELDREAQALKSCNNSIAPINRLPPEVLSNILQFSYVAAQPDEEVRDYYDGPNFTWIWVTHVCRRWREVALRCSTLWSESLSFTKPEFARAAINRSRDAPLEITYQNKPNESIDSLREALSQIHRIRSVNIYHNGDFSQLRLKHLFELNGWSGTAPILETLRLSTGPVVDMPEVLLKGGAPALKELSIGGVSLKSWSYIPLGPALVHLDLSNAPGTPRPAWIDFLEALRRMPQLKRLSLSHFLPIGGYSSHSELSWSSTTLPALESLGLTDDAFAIVNTLNRIGRLPYSANLNISICDPVNEEEPVIQLLDAVKACWAEKTHNPPRFLEIMQFNYSSRNTNEAQVRFGVAFEDGEEKTIYHWSSADLTLSFLKPELGINRLVLAFTNQWDLSLVQALEVFGTINITQDSWTAILGKFPKLREILIYTDPSLNLLGVLRLVQSPNSGEAIESPQPAWLYLPALSRVQFIDVYHGRRQGIMEEVLAFLTSRSQCMLAPLKEVHFSGEDTIDEDDVERIRKACPGLNVVWDEESGSSDEED
ncbi:hypothetical protein D9611_001242 [Ephemerocybe angulata]|uniref:F-box domain-containing protein n=1 Tax=Ephemerocybe angulata TaxID=980116 RepID=A0A8H5CIR2_9AGAR|nr:hypothetical protein D9611_001242 [Tulosesus angulatus]